jgi:hypothetical protein
MNLKRCDVHCTYAAFDDLAIALAAQSHGPADRKKYPPTDFSNWATNLTKITASERIGIVFGSFFFSIQCGMANDPIKVPVVLEVLKECLHCFDAWLNQSHL